MSSTRLGCHRPRIDDAVVFDTLVEASASAPDMIGSPMSGARDADAAAS
jgi:hypothetical protein